MLERNDVLLSIAYDAFRSSPSLYLPNDIDGTSLSASASANVTYKTRNHPADSDAKLIGDVVKNAFLHAIHNLYYNQTETSNTNTSTSTSNGNDTPNTNTNTNPPEEPPSIVSSTQTSVANQRHKTLSQENGVGSAGGEVMALSYMYPVRRTFMNEKKAFRDEERDRVLSQILDLVDEYLNSQFLVIAGDGDGDDDGDKPDDKDTANNDNDERKDEGKGDDEKS